MQEVFQSINGIFSFIGPLSDFLWDFPTNFAWYANIPVLGNFSFAIILLLGSGLYFSFRLGFVQVRGFKKGLGIMTEKRTIEYLKEFRPELYAGLSYGYKRIDYNQKDYTTVLDFEVYVMEQLTRLFKIGLGFDLIYDRTNVLRNIKNGETWTTAQIMNPGAHVVGELVMGKTSFMFVVGKHFGKYMHTEKNYQSYTVCYESANMVIFVLKESFSLMNGLNSYSTLQYAGLLREANSTHSPTAISTEDDLISFEYGYFNKDENITYTYFTTAHKGYDAFWTVQFACKTENFESLKPDMIKYAKSITLGE